VWNGFEVFHKTLKILASHQAARKFVYGLFFLFLSLSLSPKMPKNYDCYAIKVKFDNASNAHNKYKCDDITFPFPPSTFSSILYSLYEEVLDTYSARGLMWKTFLLLSSRAIHLKSSCFILFQHTNECLRGTTRRVS
jgi:hypothetical protein